jgi:hypothetical protein
MTVFDEDKRLFFTFRLPQFAISSGETGHLAFLVAIAIKDLLPTTNPLYFFVPGVHMRPDVTVSRRPVVFIVNRP